MDFGELAALAGGHAEARAIQVAIKLGLFEALSRGALNDFELASRIGCDRRATQILANAMVALGLLSKSDAGFELSEIARRFLIESSDEYLGGMILFDEANFPLWSRLEESIRSGSPARAPDMFQARPEETARFIGAMDSLVRARGDARFVADALDLRSAKTIADVGGGPGTYVAEILRRWPSMRGAIYDLPATLAVARTILMRREPEIASRLELIEVNYLTDELPGPRDLLFMSNIIHGEDEAANQELMRKCFRALTPGGRLVIKDHLMNRDLTEPRAGAIFSLAMLLTTRGRDYSFDEVSEWLRSAGFTGVSRRDLPSPPFTSSMVVAARP